MKGMDLSKHFSLQSSSEVAKICDEILKDLSITFFNYIKIHHDGSRSMLTNNASWIEYFYKQRLYESDAAIDVEYLLPKGYFLWSELRTYDPAFSDGREFFNIDNGLSFVIKQKKSTVIYIFASTRDNIAINGFYLRNIDLLKRFILYFNDKAQPLIEQANEQRIILPRKQIITDRQVNTLLLTDQQRKAFLDKTDIDRFFLEEEVYLTKRQAECAVYSLNGLTSKQIGKLLNLSYRTVESYIDNVKEKLGANSKEELDQEITRAGLLDVFELQGAS